MRVSTALRANLSLPINGSGLWVHEGGFFLYPPLAEALEELKAQSGKHFDPKIIEACLKVFEEEPSQSQ
jgi:hypothetical protein